MQTKIDPELQAVVEKVFEIETVQKASDAAYQQLRQVQEEANERTLDVVIDLLKELKGRTISEDERAAIKDWIGTETKLFPAVS